MSRVLFWTSSSLSDRHLAIFVTCSAASLIYFSKFSKRFLFTLCSTCFTVSNFPCYFILNSSLFSKLENIGELNTLVRIWNKRGGIDFLYNLYWIPILFLYNLYYYFISLRWCCEMRRNVNLLNKIFIYWWPYFVFCAGLFVCNWLVF